MGYALWAIGGLGFLVITLMVLAHAFQNAVWKGVVALLFLPYWLYYAIAEWRHPRKILLLIGWVVFLAMFFIGWIMEAAKALAPQ